MSQSTSLQSRTNSNAVRFAAIFMLAYVANLTSVAGAHATPALPSSTPLWSAQFRDLSGSLQNLSQWRGKTVILYFWASWCAPCHKEAPRLSSLYEKHKDKGLVVIGLAVDNADKVRKFVEKNALKNPIVYGGSEAIQLGRDLGNAMGAIPYTVVIDSKGLVVETIRGDTPDGKIEALIEPLLG